MKINNNNERILKKRGVFFTEEKREEFSAADERERERLNKTTSDPWTLCDYFLGSINGNCECCNSLNEWNTYQFNKARIREQLDSQIALLWQKNYRRFSVCRHLQPLTTETAARVAIFARGKLRKGHCACVTIIRRIRTKRANLKLIQLKF